MLPHYIVKLWPKTYDVDKEKRNTTTYDKLICFAPNIMKKKNNLNVGG